MLYNLGVGASTKTEHGLELLYEGSENFAALSSFGVIPAFGGLTGLVSGKVPGLDIDLFKVSMRKHLDRWEFRYFCGLIKYQTLPKKEFRDLDAHTQHFSFVPV